MTALVSAVIGALVGAGFASGRELVTFFVAFGSMGFWGIGLMTMLFCAGGLLLLWLCKRLELDSYQALLQAIFPPFWGKVFDGLVSAGLWLGLAMMLVGCGTLGRMLLGMPQWVGFAVGMVLTFVPLRKGGDGFLRVNGWLIPVMIGFAVLMALVFLNQPIGAMAAFPQVQLIPNWPAAALLYWLYNMLLSMAVLVGVRRRAKVGVSLMIGSVIIGAMALLLACCLHLLPQTLQQSQMPMLALASAMGGGWKICYGIVMILAMYTTALANCYGLVVNYEYRVKNRTQLLLFILLPTVLFGPFDFAALVGTVYPILGYASAPIMAGMIIKAAKMLFGGRL